MLDLNHVAIRIIREQERIIGPIAWSEARKVDGLKIVDEKAGTIEITNSNATQVIDRLVAQYERLFGRASHEVSREAASPLIAGLAAAEVPASLR